jgi:hypothetical protein
VAVWLSYLVFRWLMAGSGCWPEAHDGIAYGTVIGAADVPPEDWIEAIAQLYAEIASKVIFARRLRIKLH